MIEQETSLGTSRESRQVNKRAQRTRRPSAIKRSLRRPNLIVILPVFSILRAPQTMLI